LTPDPVCIVLAAGAARRFGGEKLLARLGDGRLIDRALEACGDRRTIVVASPSVCAVLEASPRRTIVVNDAPERGMNRSLQLALQAVPADAPFIVLLADMPYVDRTLVNRVATEARASESDVCYPAVGGVPAHPVFFGPAVRALVDALGDGDGLRHVRDAPPLRRRQFPIDDARFAVDVDTRETLAALRNEPPLLPPLEA
jgi:molybdenum cofactor cytidylyltransferase